MVSQPDSLSASSAHAGADVLDSFDADDAFDSQATQQLPAADRTVTDLLPLDDAPQVAAAIPADRPSETLQEHPALHDEPSVIISASADATGEIGIEDIVEIAEALAKKKSTAAMPARPAARQAAPAVGAEAQSKPPVPTSQRPPVPASKRPPVPSQRPPVAQSRSELSEVFGAITPKKLQELADAGMLAAPPVPADLVPTAPPPAMLQPPPSRMPYMEVSEPLELRPSSIAPFAVDARGSFHSVPDYIPARRPSMAESTAELARAAGVPSRTAWQTVAGIAGAIALSTIALGLVGYSVTHRAKTRTATVVVDQPSDIRDIRTPSLEEKRAAAIPPPAATSDNQTAPSSDTTAPADGKVAAQKPAEQQVTLTPEPIAATFVPAPPPRRAAPSTPITSRPAQPRTTSPAAAAPAAASKPVGTGTLRVPTAGVLVDGAPKKAINGAVTVSCGRHVVKAPMRGQKTIDVPCGGTASF